MDWAGNKGRPVTSSFLDDMPGEWWESLCRNSGIYLAYSQLLFYPAYIGYPMYHQE